MSETIFEYRDYSQTIREIRAIMNQLQARSTTWISRSGTKLEWFVRSALPEQFYLEVLAAEKDDKVGLGVILFTQKLEHVLVEAIDNPVKTPEGGDSSIVTYGGIGVVFEDFARYVKVQILRDKANTLYHHCDSNERNSAAERAVMEALAAQAASNKVSEMRCKRGRPCLTEEELRDRARMVMEVQKKAKELGITLEQACSRVGYAYSSYRFWQRRVK